MGSYDPPGSQGPEDPAAAGQTEGARDSDAVPYDSATARPVQLLFALGIDGQGPLTSAAELASAARTGSVTAEDAVSKVARATVVRSAAAGFVTGEGFVVMPVALPVNVLEFYVQAARMVGAIAILRGLDIDDAQVRRAVLNTLVATQADSVLVKIVSASRGGWLARRLLHVLPCGALLTANKGIGFSLLRATTGACPGRSGEESLSWAAWSLRSPTAG